MNMFCNQCQEAAKNEGCFIKGVCGKTHETAQIQDLLVYTSQALALSILEAKKKDFDTKLENHQMVKNLFITITNANFDDQAIIAAIKTSIEMRDALIQKAQIEAKHELLLWNPQDDQEIFDKSKIVGIETLDQNEDLRSLKQYVLFGVKGLCAYLDHAQKLGYEDETIYQFVAESLIMITKEQSLESMLDWVMKTGEYGVKGMALLDTANTTSYGNPSISQVKISVGSRPGILISGHDLKDLEELLEQSKDSGIDIYTHSEMLPSHAYPQFKKYSHLYGNYGGAWHTQTKDFETFNGPVLFTTNCLVPPKSSATYNDRIYTTGATGMPQWKHIDKRLANGQKDFSEIIEHAKTCAAPTEIEKGEITIGFAHNQVLSLADKILEAVEAGAIKKMVVMSGCDARQKSREYYTDFAKALPHDTVILTSGCAKFRYNKLNLGDIGGIPRVLDAGQCNDSYSWALVALKLKEILNLDDINKLPIVFNIAWYEQKAIIVHLALLYLGVKNTHIGPTLPAFMTPNVLKVVQEKFGVQTIKSVEEDLEIFGIKKMEMAY